MKLLVLTTDDLAILLPDAMPDVEIRTVPDALDPPAAAVIDVELADELEKAGLPMETPVVWCADADTPSVDLWPLTGSWRSRVVHRPLEADVVVNAIRALTGSSDDPAAEGRAPTDEEVHPAVADAELGADPDLGLAYEPGDSEPAAPDPIGADLEPAAYTPAGDAPTSDPADGATPASARRSSPMDELWLRYRDTMLDRLDEVEVVAIRLLDQAAEPAAVRQAHEVAHKLHGSLGTFGLERGSRLAAELEALLELPAPEKGADSGEVLRIMELVVEIRLEVERCHAVTEPSEEEDAPAEEDDRPVLLIVEPDRASGDALAAAAIAQGLRPAIVHDLDAAVDLLTEQRPSGVIVDFDATPRARLRALMKDAALGTPRVAVVAHSRSADTATRAEAASFGAQGFMRWPAPTDAAVGLVARILESAVRDETILLVDTDLDALERLARDLRGAGFRVRALDHPLEFWRTLESVLPDLVILDLDLPGPSGPQLCRMIRADATWADLPVIFTARDLDLDGYRRGFRAGGDDFIPKPFRSEEIVARIAHRLGRNSRSIRDRDPGTGLPEEPLFRSLLRHLLVLADRYDEPVTVGRVRVRRPRELPRLAAELQSRLRSEDLLGAWGAGELAVARWGETAEDAGWLESWASDETGTVAYVGLADFPDVREVDRLLGEAERRLRWAIERGPGPGR